MNPYERRAKVFTPEVIARLALVNRKARERRYPILKLLDDKLKGLRPDV